ncbi:MAG: glycosyltransferase family 4 protein [Candidatus Bathyarchaeia archaeon]
MKVCFVSPSYFPTIGGTEVAIYELGKRLVNKGCEVVLVTPTPSVRSKCEDDSGMDVYRVPIPLELSMLSPIHFYGRLFPPPLISTRVLLKILEKNKNRKIDILHQFHLFYLGATCVFAKKILKIPLITSLMGWDTYDPLHPLPRLHQPYLEFVMGHSNLITSPSKRLLSCMSQAHKEKVRVIPHGVDISRFNIHVNRNEQKEKLGVKSDEILALAVQRLAPKKAVEHLIYAMSIVSKENPKVKLVIVGDGPEKARLTELTRKLGINQNVVFKGFVDSQDLPKYYLACDIFVLHSLYEQFGIVLVEAMACGKPVISTTVGAIPEIVDNEKIGFLVEPKNPKQLADAILKLANDEKLRKKFGEEGKKKAKENYDWNIIVEKYLKVYKQLI